MRYTKFLLLLLCGCSTYNPWQFDEISARTEGFDSTRLRYIDSDPIAFEMVRVGGEISAFLSLSRSEFPLGKDVRVAFHTEKRTFEDTAAVHAGRMRVRLSTSATGNLIAALQANEKVVVTIGEHEQILEPEKFEASFTRFLGEQSFYETLLKGVM